MQRAPGTLFSEWSPIWPYSWIAGSAVGGARISEGNEVSLPVVIATLGAAGREHRDCPECLAVRIL